MKKQPLIITIAILALLLGGYFVYTKIINKPFIGGWDVVPAEAIFAYEGSACESCLDKLRKCTVVQPL